MAQNTSKTGSKTKSQVSSADQLVTSETGGIELDEEELKRVSGGMIGYKIKFQ